MLVWATMPGLCGAGVQTWALCMLHKCSNNRARSPVWENIKCKLIYSISRSMAAWGCGRWGWMDWITSLGFSMLIALMVVMFLDVYICQNLSSFTFQKCVANFMSVIPYKPAKKRNKKIRIKKTKINIQVNLICPTFFIQSIFWRYLFIYPANYKFYWWQ